MNPVFPGGIFEMMMVLKL